MISLAADCLVFQLASGESIPLSADMISVELTGAAVNAFDQEFVGHAAASVFHYFQHDLGREIISVAEFASALESVLRGFGLILRSGDNRPRAAAASDADLRTLAGESGEGRELFFFPRLRNELHNRLRQSPQLVRFRGLRGCVKHLTGARRWSASCEKLQEQIVEYLRQCLTAEAEQNDCALVVQ
jgi:hypothetical protein